MIKTNGEPTMSGGSFVFGRGSLFDLPPPTKPPQIVEVDAGVATELMLMLMLVSRYTVAPPPSIASPPLTTQTRLLLYVDVEEV